MTTDMLAVVQTLLLHVGRLPPGRFVMSRRSRRFVTRARLERLEAYLIRRMIRD